MFNEKEAILQHLKLHYNQLLSEGYKEENILGIFLYGSQNYGFATEESDIDSIAIIIPSFEKFCFNEVLLSTETRYEDEHIVIKDIRNYVKMLLKQNINFLETLFTDYYIINPKYKAEWCKILEMREEIARMDKKSAMLSIIGQAKHTLKQYKIDNDYKKIYNAWRMLYFLEYYIHNEQYKKCIKPAGAKKEWLMKMKLGQLDKENLKDAINLAKINLNSYEDIAKNIECDYEKYMNTQAYLWNHVSNIMKKSFDLES